MHSGLVWWPPMSSRTQALRVFQFYYQFPVDSILKADLVSDSHRTHDYEYMILSKNQTIRAKGKSTVH